MFKNFEWSSSSCKDQLYEVKYFNQLVGYLDSIILPKRNWEEKLKLSNDDKKKCNKNKDVCKLDIFHCGKKYKQFVLGRLKDTKCFINCRNYEVLNISDWTMLKNDLFIKYIIDQDKQHININLKPCHIFPIRIYVNNSDIPSHNLIKLNNKKNLLKGYSTEFSPGSISSRELCLLVKFKLNFYAVVKNNNKYEDFILLSLLPLNEIKKYYKKKNIKLPKIIKIN